MKYKKDDWVEVIKDTLCNGRYVGAVGKVEYAFYYEKGGGFVIVELFYNLNKNQYWCNSPSNRPNSRFDVNEVILLPDRKQEELCKL